MPGKILAHGALADDVGQIPALAWSKLNGKPIRLTDRPNNGFLRCSRLQEKRSNDQATGELEQFVKEESSHRDSSSEEESTEGGLWASRQDWRPSQRAAKEVLTRANVSPRPG